jgi:methylphosphotriester-DNA--protein-cysteine methyltransferase
MNNGSFKETREDLAISQPESTDEVARTFAAHTRTSPRVVLQIRSSTNARQQLRHELPSHNPMNAPSSSSSAGLLGM